MPLKIEKLVMMIIAAQLTKIARGDVPPAPTDPANPGKLTAAQEIENRFVYSIFTEFYVGLLNAVNDEAIFTSPKVSLDLSGLGGGLASGALSSLVPANIRPIVDLVMGMIDKSPAAQALNIPAGSLPPLGTK